DFLPREATTRALELIRSHTEPAQVNAAPAQSSGSGYPAYVWPASVSGGATPAHSKWVANEPAPRAVRLAASDLDRIYGDWLGRGYLPFCVHQRDVAGLDDPLDVEVEGSLYGRKCRQLPSQRLSFLYLA